jgi:hypothetical protein
MIILILKSATTFSILKVCIKGLFVTLGIMALNIECCYVECRDFSIISLNVIMLIVVMLNVEAPTKTVLIINKQTRRRIVGSHKGGPLR